MPGPRFMLALDVGQRTGWARSDGSSGVLDLTPFVAERSPDRDHGRACAVFSDWLDAELPTVGTLVTEHAVFGRGMAHAGFVQGLLHVAYMQAWCHNVARAEATSAEWRKWLLGHARAKRAEGQSKAAATKALDAAIVDAVRARGFCPETEHAADAAGLLLYAQRDAGRAAA